MRPSVWWIDRVGEIPVAVSEGYHSLLQYETYSQATHFFSFSRGEEAFPQLMQQAYLLLGKAIISTFCDFSRLQHHFVPYFDVAIINRILEHALDAFVEVGTNLRILFLVLARQYSCLIEGKSF